jgi:PAS domain S-box-containing protein
MVWNLTTVADPVLLWVLLAVVGSAWTKVDLSVFRTVGATTREALLDSLAEGYVLLDGDGVVTDANGTDLVVVLDRDGTISFASPSFETVLGYDPATLEGQSVLTDVHAESEERFEEAFEQLLANPDTRHRFEYSVQAADGSWHVFEGLGRNLLDDDIVAGIVVTSRDITDRKRQEQDLRRQNERLEEFASVVSHDLRNPIQVAQGNVEHLASKIEEDRHLPAIERSLDRMEALIADVLELARQGERVSGTTTVSVDAVARDAWETVETGDRTLTVVGDPALEADGTRLRQLFENRFRNAVEHAGTGVTVRVGPIEPMHTGTRVMEEQAEGFYVADDGPGIPEDVRDEVFESGTTTAADGTGLGLAIVAQIVEAHGWTISATTSRDSGARFDVTQVRGSRFETG